MLNKHPAHITTGHVPSQYLNRVVVSDIHRRVTSYPIQQLENGTIILYGLCGSRRCCGTASAGCGVILASDPFRMVQAWGRKLGCSVALHVPVRQGWKLTCPHRQVGDQRARKKPVCLWAWLKSLCRGPEGSAVGHRLVFCSVFHFDEVLIAH